MFVMFTLMNLVCYFLMLKVGYIMFNNKYVFPFSLAEVFTLILSMMIFPILSLYFFSFAMSMFTFLMNFTFFVMFFFLLSMIYTSPSTKILIDIYEKKKINKSKYLKYYNENSMVNNSLKSFKTNNEIILKKNSMTLNNKTNSYTLLTLVIFVFQKMKTM